MGRGVRGYLSTGEPGQEFVDRLGIEKVFFAASGSTGGQDAVEDVGQHPRGVGVGTDGEEDAGFADSVGVEISSFA